MATEDDLRLIRSRLNVSADIREVHELLQQTRSELSNSFRDGMHELSEKIGEFVEATNKVVVTQAGINGNIEARVAALEDSAKWARVERIVHGGLSGGVVGGVVALVLRLIGGSVSLPGT